MVNREKNSERLLCDKEPACRHIPWLHTWRPHSGKLLGWKTLLPLKTVFPHNPVRLQISLNSQVFHQPLCLKDLFFPNPTPFARKVTHYWCECCDTVLTGCVKGQDPLPPEQSPPGGIENTQKCSCSWAAIPHSSRKSFHWGCAVSSLLGSHQDMERCFVFLGWCYQ